MKILVIKYTAECEHVELAQDDEIVASKEEIENNLVVQLQQQLQCHDVKITSIDLSEHHWEIPPDAADSSSNTSTTG